MRVLVRVPDQQRARRDQRGHLREVPAVGVHEEHAVAVALDAAIHHLVAQIGDARDRRGHFHALVQRRHRPGVGAAARTARHADALLVHLWPRAQVIQRADAEPRLHAGRRVAARSSTTTARRVYVPRWCPWISPNCTVSITRQT